MSVFAIAHVLARRAGVRRVERRRAVDAYIAGGVRAPVVVHVDGDLCDANVVARDLLVVADDAGRVVPVRVGAGEGVGERRDVKEQVAREVARVFLGELLRVVRERVDVEQALVDPRRARREREGEDARH